ncbi:MAG TPA: serpin family protein [Xanthobacteraceae bacterium]|nr:serpin family protein [Xanthobacteraceae bacterium]
MTTRVTLALCLSAAAALASISVPVADGSARVAEDAASRLMSAQGALAVRLLDALATKDATANIVVSPASVAGALAAIELGADDPWRRSLHHVLGFQKPAPGSGDFEALRKATGQAREDGPLASANAVVFDRATAPYPSAVVALTQAGVRATVEDFANPATIEAINGWVSDKTRGKIPTILEDLSGDAGLVALNALYFKDRWKQPFVAAETRSAPFHLVGGQSVDVPLMQAGDGRFRFRQDARFVAVELAYATEGYSMVVVTTRRDPAPVKDFARLGAWLSGDGFADAPGEVALPRFKASANLDLMPALTAMGLQPQSTLPGFAKGPLHVIRAQQRVELAVDEEGTEAAAATAVIATRSAEPEFVKLTADKPFVFALRDQRTGLIVVCGYIGNPQPYAAQASDAPAAKAR